MYPKLEMSYLITKQLDGNQGIHAGDGYLGGGHWPRGL